MSRSVSQRIPLFLGAALLVPSAGALGLWQARWLSWDVAGIGGVLAFSVALVWVYGWSRRERGLEDQAALAEAIARNLHLPVTLHPVIDPDRCIGSLSCIPACPEGDIMGLIGERAALINGSACIGHGQCALECPVDAIRLVFGTSERGLDLPEVSEHFESARPGVYIIGELGGMGLIKNAMAQGLELAEHLGGRRLGSSCAETVEVVIVGAGPAGLAAALGCKSRGLSFRLLEQGSLGGTIFSYPRQKLVMMKPVRLPLVGRFGKRLISKEELLGLFSRAVKKAGLAVEEGTRVTGIEGALGDFTVLTTQGAVRARTVVLAIGRRGTPRKLGARGEEQQKVAYRLVDPRQYDGARVLVVGGGDSALEAAIQLVEQSTASVTLSYRKAELGKAREVNKGKVHDLARARRLRLLMSSSVEDIRPTEAVLRIGEQPVAIANDFVIACLGGELPTQFLSSVGVSLRRHFGSAPGEQPGRAVSGEEAEKGAQARLAATLFAIGALTVALLAVVGWDYYPLSAAERLRSPLHGLLRPSGPWGHGVGVVATVFMLSNFAYALRKRWRRLKGGGPIRSWLTVHQFVGFMSPLVICYHATFKANNVLATSTAVAMGVVVATGVVGRYLLGRVSEADGQSPGYPKLKRLLRIWRLLHVALAVFLVIIIAAHIAVSLRLGFKWVL